MSFSPINKVTEYFVAHYFLSHIFWSHNILDTCKINWLFNYCVILLYNLYYSKNTMETLNLIRLNHFSSSIFYVYIINYL